MVKMNNVELTLQLDTDGDITIINEKKNVDKYRCTNIIENQKKVARGISQEEKKFYFRGEISLNVSCYSKILKLKYLY